MVTVDVIPLHLADVHFPAGHPQEGEQGPVFAFALVHPEGEVLFDTDLGSDEPEVEEWFRPTRRPLPEALAAHGIDLLDVVAVVNSHLHFDHCGQNRLFRGTPIFVQSSEYRGRTSPTTPCRCGSTSRTRPTRCWGERRRSSPGSG